MDARERTVRYYQQPSGISPFRDWRAGLADREVKAAVDARIARLRAGNFGDSKAVGKGVSESRIDVGPGFRLYYGVTGNDIILLAAGDKSTQVSDIEAAQSFWEDYKERVKEDARKSRLQSRPPGRSKK